MVPQSFQSTVHITHITTATTVIEIDGVNFLTDPVFCPAPAEYDVSDALPKGTQKVVLKVSEGPALGLDKIPVIDAVLLSHEDHVDNLDEMGRRLLDGRRVITTPDGAKNLSPRPGVLGIKPWETIIMAINGIEWEVTGVPCVHLDGEVTGFVLTNKNFGTSPEGLPNAIYFTGDTILIPEHDEIAKRFHIVISLMNLGDARSPVAGRDEPLQITMGGKEGAQLFKKLGADILVPIHYESWAHFTQHGKELKEAFEEAGVEDKVCWLVPGERKCLVGPSA